MMDQATLKAELRTKTGKGSARATRREGKIPAVVYSKDSEAVSIALDPAELRKAVVGSEHRFNTVLTLEIAGSTERTALLKDWQVDPVDRRLLHADFLEIKMGVPLEADVPILLVGKAPGVTEGGILAQIRRVVRVRCLPKNIPVNLDVDISGLEINDSLHVADIVAPSDVELIFAQNFTIAVCTPPEKEEVVAVDELLAGEVPEGEEGAPAEGEEGGAEGEDAPKGDAKKSE